MTSDTIWLMVRYILMAAGASLTAHGLATEADVNAVIGALGVIFTFAWGVYVHWNTKAVPVETAARADVPTINPVTGAQEAGTAFRG